MKKFLIFVVTFSTLLSSEFEYITDEQTIPLLNPSLARRETAKIRLKNGLEAYIISDPETDQSGASLTVETGLWNDPPEYPGMAHFCEHMLFLGTTAYPSESEYDQFIADNGGGLKTAFTNTDHTLYMFSINDAAFPEALGRFSHFFIDPLFNTSSSARELVAVDEEFAHYREDDGRRMAMVLQETCNQDHPHTRFSLGNAHTLAPIPLEALVKWYEENYTPDQMHLVVISSLPLEQLIEIVVKDFSPIPERIKTPLIYPDKLLSSTQEGHIVYINPIKNIKNLHLIWEIPTEFLGKGDIFNLMNYVLTHQGNGTLSEELKRENLIEALSCNINFFSHDTALFTLSFALTDQGLNNFKPVIERTFQALNYLKTHTLPDYLFEEQKQLSLTHYQYQDRQDCFSSLTHLGSSILYAPLSTFPEKLEIVAPYNPNFLKNFIETLTPERCAYIVLANPQLTEIPTTTQEKWMQVDYAIKAIPPEQLREWKNASPHLHFPKPNPFIPHDLSLLPPAADEEAPPEVLIQDEESLIYFKQDSYYQIPTSSYIFSLRSPLFTGAPKATALLDLYILSFFEQLSETLSFAQAVGIYLNYHREDLQITLSTSGYNGMTSVFLKTVFENLSSVEITESTFLRYKEHLAIGYQNELKKSALDQGMECLHKRLVNTYSDNPSLLSALSSLSYEEFQLFCQTIFQHAYVEGMIYGNTTPALAKQLCTDLKLSLGAAPYVCDEHIQASPPLIAEGEKPLFLQTEMQGNSTILALHQGAYTLEKRCAQQILNTLLETAFFDSLRTKQQTGYLVGTMDLKLDKQLFQMFYVQSNTYKPHQLLEKFEIFLQEFHQNLQQNLTPERFENIRSNLITSVDTPPGNQYAMAFNLYNLAFTCAADFEHPYKKIDTLENLSYDFVIASADEFFSPTNSRRLAICVEGKP